MHLGYSLYSSLFFLSQYNLYLLVVLLLLGFSIDKFNFNATGKKNMSILNNKLPWSSWKNILIPFIFLFYLSLVQLRVVESSSIIGDLVFTTAAYKWLFFVYFLFFTFYFSLIYLGFKGSFFSIEFFVSLLLIMQVWSWLPLLTNWLTILLFFEIAALCLLLFNIYTSCFDGSQNYNKYKKQESNYSVELNFLRFFIFFLWLSVIATFLFFWTLAFGYIFWLGFDLHTMVLLNIYVWGGSFSSTFLLTFFLGLLSLGFTFKLILIPLQNIFLTIYGSFSFRLILLYFVVYYVFFLFIAFFAFGFIFYMFWGGWGFIFLLLSFILLFFLSFTLTLDVDFKNIFVVSSIVNLTLLLLILL